MTSKMTAKLERNIGCVKYTLFCFNVVQWIFGLGLFGVTVWIRSDTSFREWVNILEIGVYYIGIYILILTSVLLMVVSFLGCLSSLLENTKAITLFIATQILSFVLLVVGTALLLEFSSSNSSVQPIIHDTMTRLIMTSEQSSSATILRMIQENIGCCGAKGPNDYLDLRQPLPSECRNTVTGNAFFYGCVEELTWFLEEKSGWIAGIGMAVALVNVVDAVLSIILIQIIKREEEEAQLYRN